MNTYSNLNGNSNVSAYEIGIDRITVQFKDGSVYLYTNASAGSANIEQMKTLARTGKGLNGFINSNVKYKYEKKLR